jgi:transcriptional regulator with XRE-family HTH domain
MIITVEFPERLAKHRHNQGLTQTALAERVGIHVSQIRRYEQGAAQPTLDVIRRLTLALNTNADQLIFNSDENSAENGDGTSDSKPSPTSTPTNEQPSEPPSTASSSDTKPANSPAEPRSGPRAHPEFRPLTELRFKI